VERTGAQEKLISATGIINPGDARTCKIAVCCPKAKLPANPPGIPKRSSEIKALVKTKIPIPSQVGGAFESMGPYEDLSPAKNAGKGTPVPPGPSPRGAKPLGLEGRYPTVTSGLATGGTAWTVRVPLQIVPDWLGLRSFTIAKRIDEDWVFTGDGFP
jgi:hypothetical protein